MLNPHHTNKPERFDNQPDSQKDMGNVNRRARHLPGVEQKSSDDPELRYEYTAAPVFEVDLYRGADLHSLALGDGKIRDHQQHRLFLEFDHDIDERRFGFEARHIALMHHRERMNSAAAADRFKAQLLRQAGIAYISRRMVVIAAGGAVLDKESTLLHSLPKRQRGVIGDRDWLGSPVAHFSPVSMPCSVGVQVPLCIAGSLD